MDLESKDHPEVSNLQHPATTACEFITTSQYPFAHLQDEQTDVCVQSLSSENEVTPEATESMLDI